jgi:zinc transporter ZupT
MIEALRVLAAATVTAAATGLGALPFAFVRRVSARAVAVANALAAGLMLGASFGLLAEGTREGSWQTVAGANLGVLFVLATERILSRRELRFGAATGLDARRMALMVVVMTVHSLAEGVAVGTAFGGGARLATVITVAIAVHNVPEGLAITAVLRPRGTGIPACAGWSIVSSLPQPLLAVPAYLFVEAFRPALPYGMGFAAGAMVFMVLMELLPEAYGEVPRLTIGVVTSLALMAMILFQRIL